MTHRSSVADVSSPEPALGAPVTIGTRSTVTACSRPRSSRDLSRRKGRSIRNHDSSVAIAVSANAVAMRAAGHVCV